MTTVPTTTPEIGRLVISAKLARMPITGSSGTSGTVSGRSMSGNRRRETISAALTTDSGASRLNVANPVRALSPRSSPNRPPSEGNTMMNAAIIATMVAVTVTTLQNGVP